MQDEIKKCIDVLRAGGVILYPTDTVWGLGCDATNEEAVKRIFEIKKRADAKAMLVLVDNAARIQGYVDEVPDMAWELIDVSEKPLTIIYPEAKNLAKNLIAEDKSIGIRVNYVVNFRQNETNAPKPSSIIKLGKGNVIQIIRE